MHFAPVPQPAAQAKPALTASRQGVAFAPVPALRRDAPVQRYKMVPVNQQNAHNYGLAIDLRVSNDGRMAVRDTANTTPNGSNQYQDLYLSQDVLNASQQILTNLASGVTLTATGATITGKPQGNFLSRTLHQVTVTFADTPNNESYEDCDANMGNVIGTQRNNVGTTQTIHGVFSEKLNGSRFLDVNGDSSAAYKAIRTRYTGFGNGKSAQNAWENLDESYRKSKAKKYGFNKYAKPKTGEGIGIFKAGSTGSTGAGHFAGVIARSGGDYITLENYAGNPGAVAHPGARINPNWYLRMFGAKNGQSFYDFHKTHETAEYGAKPIAIRFRGR